jgi:hypothetical protein
LCRGYGARMLFNFSPFPASASASITSQSPAPSLVINHTYVSKRTPNRRPLRGSRNGNGDVRSDRWMELLGRLGGGRDTDRDALLRPLPNHGHHHTPAGRLPIIPSSIPLMNTVPDTCRPPGRRTFAAQVSTDPHCYLRCACRYLAGEQRRRWRGGWRRERG